MNQENLDRAVIGAYLTDGIFFGATDRLLNLYAPDGHIGLVFDVCKYADYILGLRKAGFSIVNEYPGVFEYDVVEPFGKWYQESLINRLGQPPTPDMCRMHLINAVQHFFCLCCHDEALLGEQLGIALMNVHFGDAVGVGS
jgi:hypothetical protein